MNNSIRSSFLKTIDEEEKVDQLRSDAVIREIRVDGGARPEVTKKVVVPPPPKNKAEIKKKPSDEDINDSAEAFIRKFRQQLVLQRLESIENYEQMLKRGT
ncbi:hypothetical protein ABFS82_09G094600 [Erythranthe guttata]|uniref:DUF4408 domain-containing protein n=1 Tax=Erythranthe guttata TaxID=4155 RepID=A0A022Q1H8_ERYGU|nr:PREDICTED: uncharacterized protein LOC105975616 [Erythranthe guttata]EYU21619.1 hypothetical protein MIMGU_mgv1a016935mg [Erythranthe guttata]|eukprot:XP_012856266.1 PREDICTED: uncharacterized protein LOC105975616 [Erythranthe guttata]